MATVEVTEYPEPPVRHGNQSAIATVPIVRHQTITIGAGEELQLHADTRYFEFSNASADFRFKIGPSEAAVTGGNAPTSGDAPQVKADDRDRGFQLHGKSNWLATV